MKNTFNRRDFIKTSLASAATYASFTTEIDAAEKTPNKTEKKNLIGSAPMLQNGAADSISIVFEVTADAIGYVDISTSPDMKNAVRHFSGSRGLVELNDKIARILVSNLKPATRYWYKIGADRIAYDNGYSMKNLGSETDGEIRSFTTLGEGAKGAFCVINDTHENKKTLNLLFNKIAEIKPAAVIWNGDATNVTETKEHAAEIFLHPHPNHPEYAAQTPYLFVNGNHDLRGRFARTMEEILMLRNPSERSQEFSDLGRNFVQRLGSLALIGLDTGEDKLDTNPIFAGLFQMEKYREQQARFLAEAIETPAVKTAKFKVVFCHIPLFDPNKAANPGDLKPRDTAPGYNTNYAMWQRTCANLWGDLFVRAGVQLVIAAHQHQFRYDAPTAERPWAQIIGGGHKLDGGEKRFPTVIEGNVENDKLVVKVHDVRSGGTAGEFIFT